MNGIGISQHFVFIIHYCFITLMINGEARWDKKGQNSRLCRLADKWGYLHDIII